MSEIITFDYKYPDGRTLEVKVKVQTIFQADGELLMQGINAFSEGALLTSEVFLLRNIVHKPLPKEELYLGDRVRFTPTFKSQRTLEGIVCFIEGERIYFYSGIMPIEFYGTPMAQRPGKDVVHQEVMYNWELMIHPRKNLEKI